MRECNLLPSLDCKVPNMYVGGWLTVNLCLRVDRGQSITHRCRGLMGSPRCQLGRCRGWRVRASPSSSRRATFTQEKRTGLPQLPQDRGHGVSSTSGTASRILKLATSPTPLNPELEEHRRPVNEMGVQPGADLCGRRAPAFDLDQITSLVGDFGRGGVLEIVDAGASTIPGSSSSPSNGGYQGRAREL